MRSQIVLPLALLAAFLGAFALGGCGKCRLSSDCEQAQHCNFTTGECLDGCMSAGDCAPTANCDTSTGKCVPTFVLPRPDTGTSSTSTAADAG